MTRRSNITGLPQPKNTTPWGRMSAPRKIAVAALMLPMMLWYWPRWIMRDLVAGHREAAADRARSNARISRDRK